MDSGEVQLDNRKNMADNIDCALDSLGMLSTETELHKEHKKTWIQSELRIEFTNYKPILCGHTRPRNSSRLSYPSKYNEKMCVRMCPGFRSRTFPRPYRPYDFPWRRSLIHQRMASNNDSIHKQLEKLSLKSDSIHCAMEKLSIKPAEPKPVLDTVVEHLPFESTSKFYVPLNNYPIDNKFPEPECVFKPLTRDVIENLSVDFNKMCSRSSASSRLEQSSDPENSVSL